MKILLSGANGFLGKAMQTAWRDHHEIVTLGRGGNAMIVCDLSRQVPVLPVVDMVVHAAGKAHVVPKTTAERDDFFSVNVQGTKNLLQALENNRSPEKFIFISTVSVYGLNEGINISETAPLLAEDPYGQSKIEAEKLVADWCTKRNIKFYILRVPLIAGKDAPGNLGAMIKGIKNGRYLSIGKSAAKKSIVLADDLARFLPGLQGQPGIYNLTDGYHPSFGELEHYIASFYNKKKHFSLPLPLAKMLGIAGDLIGTKFPVNSARLKKITSTLTFDDSKARKELQWHSHEILKAWTFE
ncbi:MAG: NAD-dependent epimerase/dehydratase family protein [Ferruginibacter sp.]